MSCKPKISPKKPSPSKPKISHKKPSPSKPKITISTCPPKKNPSKLRDFDIVWDFLISHLGIDINQHIQYISAKDIKNSKQHYKGTIKSQFEPRLLCKMDDSLSRPKIFIDNGLSLLSIKNGVYAIIKEKLFWHLPNNLTPKLLEQKKDINDFTMLKMMGNGEMDILDILKARNIFDDILGEKIIHGPLFRGRHRGTFTTYVGNQLLKIKGSQYEIDSCYETKNYICIVEAKSKECTDFNIRQLYFPFKAIHDKIGHLKEIISLFIYKDKKGIIHIHKLIWNDPEIMMDIKHLDYFNYIL